MERDRAALPLVDNLNLQSQNITQLTFKRLEIRIGSLGGVPGTRPAYIVPRSRPASLSPSTFFGLAHRIALRDDLAGQFFRAIRRRNSPRVAHADIAFQ